MTPRDHCQVRSTSSLSSSKYNDDMAMESSKRRSTWYARFPLENFGLPSWTFRYISTIFRSVKPEWFYHLHSGRIFGINGKKPTSHRSLTGKWCQILRTLHCERNDKTSASCLKKRQ